MSDKIKIEAKNKKQALKKGKEELENRLEKEITEDDLEIEVVEENNGFMGVFGGKSVYEVKLTENNASVDQVEETIQDIKIDGEFAIKVHPEGIHVKITPPEGKGERVSYQEVKKALREKKIKELDHQKVQEAVKKQEDKWIKVAPRKPDLDEDGEIWIDLDQDKLKAFLDYKPALGGEKITLTDIRQELEEAGIVYGIKEDKLQQVVKSREKQKELLVAEGKEPEPGEDGKLIYHFEDKQESIGTQREDGSIDFYNLDLITNVKPGDKLVTLKDPKPGNPGKTVTGEEVPPSPPQEEELPSGKNVEQKDEKTLVAAIEGQVVKEGKRVKVLPVHEVNGNVDINTGNIDFVGNVIVRGNVEEGFCVEADGNVEVKGRVSAGEIHSGGEVVVNKGFVGKDKGKISAEGNVKVKFVENGEIESKNSIIVSDAVMHSQLVADEDIIVTENKGLLVGGKCRAGHHVKANIMGSSMATITVVEAGVNPECKKRLKEIEEELEQSEQNLLKTKRALQVMERIKEKQGKLPTDKEISYHRLKKTKKKIENSISEKKSEQKELQEKLENTTQGKVAVNEKVYSGVKMTIGSSQYNVQEELRHSSFIEDEGEVRQIPQ